MLLEDFASITFLWPKSPKVSLCVSFHTYKVVPKTRGSRSFFRQDEWKILLCCLGVF